MTRTAWLAGLVTLLLVGPARAQEGLLGTLDLSTAKGVAAVKGEWRYHDVTTGVGPKNNMLEPKAHGTFDDAKWDVLKPEAIRAKRGAGKYCFGWYRIQVTIPDKVDGKSFAGGPVWFETTATAYGEVWVDGALNHKVGETGRGEISGYETPNRVRLQKTVDKKKRDAQPGDVFQLAVLVCNGPLGNAPANKFALGGFTGLEFFDAKAPNGGENKPHVAQPPAGKPVGTINLMSQEGTDLVKGAWRRQLIQFHTGKDKNEIEPRAHDKNFDDGKWEVVEDPSLLKKAFGPGSFSMAWYRIKVTLPQQVEGQSVAGKEVWFRTTVDDYGEIYVDGVIDLSGGKAGRGGISGFNFPNEVLLTANAKPGQTIQIAVLAINSPFGNPPGNFIFFRNADLRFFTPPPKAKK